jgi:4-hydroxy-3-methylbut-2-enyl diphosphate reductase
VAKVHLEAIHFAQRHYTIILIGHAGHDEVLGTLGEAPASIRLVQTEADVERLQVEDPARIAYLTQTTLSLDDTARLIEALRRRFPHIIGPAKADICYATQNRQETVKELLAEVDVVLVLGSQNSSNSQRLREIAADGASRPTSSTARTNSVQAGFARTTSSS